MIPLPDSRKQIASFALIGSQKCSEDIFELGNCLRYCDIEQLTLIRFSYISRQPFARMVIHIKVIHARMLELS